MDEVSASKPKDAYDDRFSAICGDLGLGEGLKPGGIFRQNSNTTEAEACVYNPTSQTSSTGSSSDEKKPSKLNRSDVCHCQHNDSKLTFSSTDCCNNTDFSEGCDPDSPKQASTSILKHLVHRKTNLGALSPEEVQKKLLEAVQEVEELKLELDTCRRRLDAKYKAIAILRKKAESATKIQVSQEQVNAEISQELIKEVNKLQFELEWKESSFMDSQQTWAERFDRMCQETAVLMSTLEARSEELRRMSAQKMALMRERDELLALLDVRERERYSRCCAQNAEDDYGTFSSIELAVLGACRCRGPDAQPCGCAHAAANIRREVIKLREEIELHKQRREEAFMTVDAYRKAFEEQLARSKTMSVRLAELAAPPTSKAVKARAAIKWLISVLNDDELPPLDPKMQVPNGPGSGEEGASAMGQMLSPQELVVLLTEMVHEKKEALSHQKLAAQILVNRVQELEKQLAPQTEEACSV